jgi:M6 family metalloprotease-like protein
MPRLSRCLLAVAVLVTLAWGTLAADIPPVKETFKESFKDQALPDLSEFRTVSNAVTTRISRAAPKNAGQPGYLGVHLEAEDKDHLVVAHVEPGSPAARAGLETGDLVRHIDGQTVLDTGAFRDAVQAKGPGESLEIGVVRKDKPMKLLATLGATSRPKTSGARIELGVRTSEADDTVRIDRVLPGSAGDTAGLKTGDLILKIEDTAIATSQRVTDVIGDRRPGDTVTLTIKREGKEMEIKVKLAAVEEDPSRLSWDTRGLSTWKKDVYHLAVIPIEYPDIDHNAKITPKDWEEALFSKDSYNDKNVTGQKVFGSLNDYYTEQSYGTLHVDGKVFDHVKVSKKRTDYGNDTNRFALLTEAADELLKRDGKEALKDFDGICFIYSGGRVQTNRGNLYWPHRSTFSHQGRRWPYYICPEGGSRMTDISVFCHEFGHMLGLPDLYARPENPGSEGLGIWCAMSNQLPNGRPQHFSAWCKEQLGWLKPAVLDPTVKQKLILAPVESSPKECYKILVRPDGSEYLLLENRTKKGFDHDLPAEGLLVWRVVEGHPILEESHGITGPDGPRRYLEMVPFPSTANNAFTPYTTPNSRSQLGGGLPVYITNIQKLPDGRVTFFIGYEYF